MVLKTFNVKPDVFAKFSEFCKEHGLSMSRQINDFMARFNDEVLEVRPEYLKKLDRIEKGRFTKVENFKELLE